MSACTFHGWLALSTKALACLLQVGKVGRSSVRNTYHMSDIGCASLRRGVLRVGWAVPGVPYNATLDPARVELP